MYLFVIFIFCFAHSKLQINIIVYLKQHIKKSTNIFFNYKNDK